MEILEIIGYIVIVAVVFGIIGTVAFIAAVFIMQEPDCEDQDDIEIREYKFWDKKKK